MNFIAAGRTLLIHDAKMGTHLWFVLTDPDPSTGRVVLVMLVTERSHTERTTRLTVGDHPFISHASAIDFGTATYALAAKLTSKLGSSLAKLGADMSTSLLKRVRAGLIDSSHTPNEIVRYCGPLFES